MSYGQVPPHPAALVESLRALGYSLEAAVADLIDNSISASASSVNVMFDWNGGEPFAWIMDDGRGMNVEELVSAMRLGGQGPLAERNSADLGRYGLGLKTASFSQCRRLTVKTKQAQRVACARWDLESLTSADRGWELLSEPAPGSEGRLDALESLDNGTIVLWEILQTGTEGKLQRFLEAIERLERHLQMIFHRFIEGDQRRISLKLNGRQIRAWDPFLTSHPATIRKPVARLRDVAGNAEVRGFVLPHRDRFGNASEHEIAGGPEGWVAQQGFYIYRCGRLIVAGGWLALGGSREWARDEASQLARIRIDIPNTCDGTWRIDVRKATARAPGFFRDELIRIALDVRRSARDVYAHRGARVTGAPQPRSRGLWLAKKSRRHPYAIKRDHAAVQSVLDMSTNPELVEALLVAIERSIPLSVTPSSEEPVAEETNDLVVAGSVFVKNLMALGLTREAAVLRVCSLDPFSDVENMSARLHDC